MSGDGGLAAERGNFGLVAIDGVRTEGDVLFFDVTFRPTVSVWYVPIMVHKKLPAAMRLRGARGRKKALHARSLSWRRRYQR